MSNTTIKKLIFDADFCAKADPRDLENLGWDFTMGHEDDEQLDAPGKLKWHEGDYIKIWMNDAGEMLCTVVSDGLERGTMECGDTTASIIDLEILHERGRLWLQ
jgi:hypothetical protein